MSLKALDSIVPIVPVVSEENKKPKEEVRKKVIILPLEISRSLPKIKIPTKEKPKETKVKEINEEDDWIKVFPKAKPRHIDIGSPSIKKLVDNKSYFKHIQTFDDKKKYMDTHHSFQKQIIEMKERINNLKSSIGEIYAL